MRKPARRQLGRADRGWFARYWKLLLGAGVALAGFLTWYDTVRNQGKLFVCDVVALLGQSEHVSGCAEPGIPPLENPKSVPVPRAGDATDLGGGGVIAAARADAAAPADATTPRTVRILEGDSDSSQRRLFDITIENPTDRQVTLESWEVRWRYYQGALSGVEQAAVIAPSQQYTITLDIDTGNVAQRSKSIPVASTIVLPAGSPKSPSVYVFRLELLYAFDKGSTYHPTSDWNILFDLDIKTIAGQAIPIFRGAKWRD